MARSSFCLPHEVSCPCVFTAPMMPACSDSVEARCRHNGCVSQSPSKRRRDGSNSPKLTAAHSSMLPISRLDKVPAPPGDGCGKRSIGFGADDQHYCSCVGIGDGTPSPARYRLVTLLLVLVVVVRINSHSSMWYLLSRCCRGPIESRLLRLAGRLKREIPGGLNWCFCARRQQRIPRPFRTKQLPRQPW